MCRVRTFTNVVDTLEQDDVQGAACFSVYRYALSARIRLCASCSQSLNFPPKSQFSLLAQFAHWSKTEAGLASL